MCKQKQSLLFNLLNMLDLLTSRTDKIVCWPSVFRYFLMKNWEQFLKKLIDKFLLYHTSLRELLRPLEDIICFNFISTTTGGHICSDHDENLLSLPPRFGGFAISIKTKGEKRYRNTLTQLQGRTNDNEWRLNTISQEKRISNWLTLYPIAIKGLILLSNHVHVPAVRKQIFNMV